MSEYHKIQTVWLREPKDKHRTLIEGAWSKPEFEYLADSLWDVTEKVDGMNMRVIWDGTTRTIAGRTDNAQIPPRLLARMDELFPADNFIDIPPCVIYGEGYGAKIQKGGGNYIPDGQDFVAFDAKINGRWLDRQDLNELLFFLRPLSSGPESELVRLIKEPAVLVPQFPCMTLYRAIEMVREGFRSRWGDFQAEGVVCRPVVELLNSKGERVITKIKCKDFRS